jgi:hypothetical protein
MGSEANGFRVDHGITVIPSVTAGRVLWRLVAPTWGDAPGWYGVAPLARRKGVRCGC